MHYVIGQVVPVTPWSVAAVVCAGVIFGLAGLAFATATHSLGALAKRSISYPPLRPVIGGSVIALALWAFGTAGFDAHPRAAPVAAAKRTYVQQTLLYQVASGFLKGERVTHHHTDVSDLRHPRLELIDTETQLRAFMHEHAHELHKVRAVLFLCGEPFTDHAGFAAHRFPTQGDIACQSISFALSA